jgi:hypothetical protein
MSFANQPSRLLISSDDLNYGSGNSFTISLPESIVGATKADLIRAVIPNTGYPIPAYQENFYYRIALANGSAPLQVMPINTNQYFDSIAGGTYPLLTELNRAGALESPTISFTYSATTNRITVTSSQPGGGGSAVVSIVAVPRTEWLTPFALNTRLGFLDTPPTQANSLSTTGSMMPNLVRSKVIYVLCNIVMNDTISTDGLRTSLAKVPVNSVYGGLTLYVPPVLHWNRLVQGNSYQTIVVQLLDDQYQAYPLQSEEFCELEICFKYEKDVVSV